MFLLLKNLTELKEKKPWDLNLAEQLRLEITRCYLSIQLEVELDLIGMWKAFLELKELGWIKGKLPKMVAVQAEGCAPIVKAWKNGDEHAPVWQNALY